MTAPIKIAGLLTILLAAPQFSLAASDNPTQQTTPNVEQWLGEALGNINFELFMRIQKVVVENMEIIGPYTQEYYQCLKAEGALEQEAGATASLTLDELIDRAKTKGKNCHNIMESLFGELQFDITEEEFEQGLSPEYKKKYQSLKNTL